MKAPVRPKHGNLKKPWEYTAAVTVDIAADASAAVAVTVAVAFAFAVAVTDTFRMGGDHKSYKALEGHIRPTKAM